MLAQAILMDGVERARENPATFNIPSKAIRETIRKGWYVKLGVEFPPFQRSFQRRPAVPLSGERFWVLVTQELTDGKYQGVVEQADLVATEAHGINHGDELTFEPRHILGFYS